MSKPKMNKKSVALFLNKRSVPEIMANASHYVTQMTGNAYFPAPVPALSTITEQVAQVQTAYTVALTRAKGKVGEMYGELKLLEISLKQLAAYVESVANQDVELAEIIILSAGMTVKKTAQRAAKVFNVKQGLHSEWVILNNKAVTRGAYIYYVSQDPQKEDSWEIIYAGLQVKFTYKKVTPGKKYYFRTMVIDKQGAVMNEAVISLIAQ